MSDVMAERKEFVLGGSSSQSQQSPSGKACKQQHRDTLQSLLHRATAQSHRDSGCSQQLASNVTPEKLFLEGFKDCASEVIRFLIEEEKVDDNSPLLIGLQSHLQSVRKTICCESVVDSDSCDSERQNSGMINSVDDTDKFCSHDSALSPYLISQIVPRSSSSSLSDTMVTESDISMSSASGRSLTSLSLDANSSLHSTSFEILDENLIDQNKSDDVFHTSDSLVQYPISPSVLPESLLVENIVHDTHSGKPPQLTDPLFSEETGCPENDNIFMTPAFSRQYHLSLNHSSASTQSCQSSTLPDHYCCQPQCLCTKPRLETTDIPQFSAFPPLNVSETQTAHPATVHSTPPQQQSNQRQIQTSDPALHPSFWPSGSDNGSELSVHCMGLSRQLSSVLELKANFLPGIETSSVASGSFADVLLAVESCRFHDDPRVRALAEELVHLIHDDDFDDEDDDLSYDHLDDNVNMSNMDGADDSQMLDVGVHWGSAVDMIEQ